MSKITKLLLERNEVNKTQVDDEVALLSRDPNHKFITKHPYYEMAKIINSKTKTINGFQTTYDQTLFLRNLEKNNVFIAQAGTGFGKTWLTSSHYMDENDSWSYLHIVPNDILVSQGIWQVGETASSEFHFNKKHYIFATPEKTFGSINELLDNFEKFDKIIFDEAHLLFGNEDHRMNFYNFIFRKLYKNKKKNQQFILLSPFLTSKNINEISKICTDEVIFEKFDGFTSEFVIQDINSNKYLSFDDVEGIDDKITNQPGIDLAYFTSAKKARECFEEVLTEKKPKELSIFIQNMVLDEKIKDAYLLCSNDIDSIINYDLLTGLSKRIALYHSGVPDSVKKLIFVLAKNGYIDRIYGTQALLNGADLKIRRIIIDDVKTNGEFMSIDDFWNLAGRSGRYSPGERRIFGGIQLVKTNNNTKWFNENRHKMMTFEKANKPSDEEDKLKWFTNQSIKKAEADTENRRVYLSDPRINPIVSLKLFKDKVIAQNFLERILRFIDKGYNTNEIEWPDGKDALEIIEPIFKYYKESIPKGGWKYFDINGGKRKTTALRMFIKWFNEFDESSIIRGYSWFWFFKINGPNSSSKFEEFISLFKNRTKYEILLVLNHVFLINKELGHINYSLYDLLYFRTKNVALIYYIKSKNLEDKYDKFLNLCAQKISKYHGKRENLESFKDFVG